MPKIESSNKSKIVDITSNAAENMAKDIVSVREEVKARLEATGLKNKAAPDKHRRVKVFQPRKYGPFKIERKINDNAYVVSLPNDMNISNTFNVADILAYHPEASLSINENSESSSLQVGVIDAGAMEAKDVPMPEHYVFQTTYNIC
ncbi:hypothetical protein OROGR_003602 [Orobanche gracilis]